MNLNQINIWLIELIFPRDISCVLCHAFLDSEHESHLCRKCLGSIQFNTGHVCRICGRMLLENNSYGICENCKQLNRYLDAGLSVTLYDDYTKKLIFDLKYYHKRYVAHTMAVLMVDLLIKKDLHMDFDCITYVPLHPKKEKKRGFNQSQLVAREISKITGLSLKKLICRVKYTPSLNALTAEERQKVLLDVFEVSEAVKGAILIVDDIYTTGHTLNYCAQVLKARGASYVQAITFSVGR